jgi:hypothetical protein
MGWISSQRNHISRFNCYWRAPFSKTLSIRTSPKFWVKFKRPSAKIRGQSGHSLSDIDTKMTSPLAIAKSQIDYQETGNNETMYGKWYGLNNQPWCAIFVSWCFAQVGQSELIAAQSKKGFASCDAGLKWFTKKNKIVPVGQAKAGDIVFFQFDDDAQPDHVGIVTSNDGKGTLRTIEGNTSAGKGSQSNGDGVYAKKRAYSLVMGVARP